MLGCVANKRCLADMAYCLCGSKVFFNGHQWIHVDAPKRHNVRVDRDRPYERASITWRQVAVDEIDLVG